MAKKPLKVLGQQVREIDGHQMMVFASKDSIGRVVELYLPASSWDLVYADGLTKIEAAANAAAGAQSGEWVRSFHREGTPAQIAATDDGKVVLAARFGTPTETRLLFDRSSALELAEHLKQTAEGLPIAAPARH